MYPALQFWKTLVLSRHLKATPPPTFHGYGWLANLLHAKKIIYVHYWFHKLTYIMLSWRYLRVVQLAWKSFPLINVSREYYLLLMTDTLHEHWWHTVTKLYWVHKLVEVLICHNNKVVVSNLSWEYCSLLITCVHSIYVVQLAWKSFPLINASWDYYLLLMADTPHEHWWHTVTKLYWFINWLICHNKEVVSNLSWEYYCSFSPHHLCATDVYCRITDESPPASRDCVPVSPRLRPRDLAALFPVPPASSPLVGLVSESHGPSLPLGGEVQRGSQALQRGSQHWPSSTGRCV